MRIMIAGVLGGIALFFWGFLAHTVLPLGELGMRAPVNEDAVLAAMKTELSSEGVYYLPYLAPDKMHDEAAMAAWSEKAKTHPYALVIYQPEGRDGAAMGPQLGIQFLSDTAVSIALAFILAGVSGLGRRLVVAVAIGVIGWLAISLPYWNWYRFPLDFTLANLAEQAIGLLLAGLAASLWLRRNERR